jgi:putative DNA primase/helicase
MNGQQAILIQRLKEGELSLNRFLKIDEKKAAIEKEWQNRLYSPEDLDSFPRWGICGKDLLVLIDCDKREMYDLLSKTLPQTFEVTSPRRGLPHKYFIVCGEQIQNKTLHMPNDEEGAGEIRADNQYLVAAGTEITYKDLETGEQKTGVYTVTKNIPIARMERDDFMQAVTPYLGRDSKQPITYEQMRKGVPIGTRHQQGIKYATFLVGVQKFDYATALAEMLRWNQLCQPPMDKDDLKRMVENALGYVEATPQLNKQPLTYLACPNEGGVLQIIETDSEGKSIKYYCPICREETTEAIVKTYAPNLYSYEYFCDDPKKRIGFKPAQVAQSLKDNFLFRTDRTSDLLLRYDDARGVWSSDGEVYLSELVAQSLGKENYECHFRNIRFHLKSITHQDVEFKTRWIATPNCLLDPQTRLTKPFTPNEFIVQQIPHKFDPEAKCPAILKVLTEIVGEKQLIVMQESIGNIFLKGHPFHKITIFIGGGGNGKGQVLELITHLIGKKNVSNITLQALCNDKYERATCYRKMVNLGRDIPQWKINATGNAKMMSGDDTMTMQNKYGHPFQATPDDLPKQFYSCNQLPPCDDDTDAWYRRQNLIAFNNHFIAGENAVPKIADKLAESETEMSGFLNWALEGTQRLLRNRCFSANENIEENREKYVKNSNPSQAYIDANLVFEQNKFIPEKELWSKVGLWCAENGITAPRNKGAFTQELTKQLPQVIQTSARVEGKSTHVYMNVTYKQPTSDFVTTVTTVTTPSILSGNQEQESIIEKRVVLPVTPVTPVTDPSMPDFSEKCEPPAEDC